MNRKVKFVFLIGFVLIIITSFTLNQFDFPVWATSIVTFVMGLYFGILAAKNRTCE